MEGYSVVHSSTELFHILRYIKFYQRTFNIYFEKKKKIVKIEYNK